MELREGIVTNSHGTDIPVSGPVSEATQRKGGRPSLSPPPQSAAATRALIAAEVVKTKPSASRVRYLGMLLKSFERAEAEAKAEAAVAEANRLTEEANVLKQGELELKTKEYQRRREVGRLTQLTDDGRKMTALRDENASLTKDNSRLQKENATLTEKFSEQEALIRKLQDQCIKTQLKMFHESFAVKGQPDALASLRPAVQTEPTPRFDEETVSALHSEFDLLNSQEPTSDNIDRMGEILARLKQMPTYSSN